MTIIEAIGWFAAAYASHTALPVADAINQYNHEFAIAVDRGDYCWDRVGGQIGVYGKPENYTLDATCNWKLEHYTEEGTVSRWRLIRDF